MITNPSFCPTKVTRDRKRIAEHCAEHFQAMRSVNGEEDDSANQRPDSENRAPRV
jgi:hypothetical protein